VLRRYEGRRWLYREPRVEGIPRGEPTVTRTDALLALTRDHVAGRHVKDHPQCPVCGQRGDMGLFYREPEWVRRARESRLPVKVW
jgi:hypothetical protein